MKRATYVFVLPAPRPEDSRACRVCGGGPVIPLATVCDAEPDCCGRCALWVFEEAGHALRRQFTARALSREWAAFQEAGFV